MKCLDDDTIAAFVQGELEEGDADAVEEHIDACDSCRQLLSRLATALAEKGDDASRSAGPNTPRSDDARTVPLSNDSLQALAGNAKEVLRSGDLVDHYRVIRPLAQGGMGRVYLAEDTKLHRRVALKVVHPKLLGSEAVAKRFLFEARATARFSHPNIVAIHSVGEIHSCPYVALEFIEGDTLRMRLQNERFSLAEAVRTGSEITAALKEAHRHGILHRDLKPSNVMIGIDGRARVLDFGLAKASATAPPSSADLSSDLSADTGAPQNAEMQQQPLHSTLTATTGYIGTPKYMAPEQWDRQEVSAATDVWALGLILHELVLGEHPFDDASIISLQQGLVDTQRRVGAAGGRDATIPSALKQLIRRCLHRTPEERPSVDDVLSGLKQLNVRSVSPRSPWLLVAIVGVIVGALSLAVLRIGNGPSPLQPAVTPAVKAQRPISSKQRDAALPSMVVERKDASVVADASVPSPKARVKRRGSSPTKRRRSSANKRRPVRAVKPRGAGRLIVITQHAGAATWANVSVDGKPRGQTPLRLSSLPAGKHRLHIHRPAFVSVKRTVDVGAKKTTRVVIGLTRL